MLRTLLALQLFQVLFIALHDWLPLGRFNDPAAARAENPDGKLLRSTVLSTAPFAALLIVTVLQYPGPISAELLTWLRVGYGLLFLGELNAWWIPYLVRAQPERAARYAKLFGRTHSFLPARNGIRPNTLHILLHATTVATLVVLAVAKAHHV